jgi:large subunit ribosomal protein L25
MEQVILPVSHRSQTGKGAARRLRTQGQVPALAYADGKEPILFSFEGKELLKLLRRKGKNTLLTLQFDNQEPAGMTVMLRDLQRGLKREPVHADFALVDQNKPIRATIPLRFDGKPVGTQLGGVVNTLRQVMVVECLPALIPHEIVADISSLQMDETFRVGSVQLPEGVKSVEDASVALVSITAKV